MMAYVQDFQFKKVRKCRWIDFKYYNGYQWKHLAVVDPFEKDQSVAHYSRFILDCVIKDICDKEKDVFIRDKRIRDYESLLTAAVQFNPGLFKSAVKVFM